MIVNRYTIDNQGLLHFEHSKTAEDVMNWLEANSQHMYTCLRGPRPSAALIDIGRSMGRIFMIGEVKPTIGVLSCQESGECMIEDGHCVRNNHAEVDALLRCARAGISTNFTTCFSVNKPCYQCTRALVAAGVTKIYYRYSVYDEPRTRKVLEAANVKAVQI